MRRLLSDTCYAIVLIVGVAIMGYKWLPEWLGIPLRSFVPHSLLIPIGALCVAVAILHFRSRPSRRSFK